MNRSIRVADLHRLLFVVAFGAASVMGIGPVQAQEMCGGATYPFPYTDVSGVGAAFCPGIMEAYVTGVSKGTTPTTFSPNDDRDPGADDNLPATLAGSGTRAHESADGAQSVVDSPDH